MKLVIDDAGDRIVRYGVSDFQVNDNDTVTLFYSQPNAVDVPEGGEETIDGTIKQGDAATVNDPQYYEEDLDYEQRNADDLEDYRATVPPT